MGRHLEAVGGKQPGLTPPAPSPSADQTARERLVLAAASLFTRKGYAATTVREIVTAAGVTKPVLYYYFQNKEGIYLELIRTPFHELDSLLDTSQTAKGSASQKILSLCDEIFSLVLENLQAARLMTSIYYGPPQGAPFFDGSVHRQFCPVRPGTQHLCLDLPEVLPGDRRRKFSPFGDGDCKRALSREPSALHWPVEQRLSHRRSHRAEPGRMDC